MLPPALSIGGYLEKRFIDVFTLYYELGYIEIKKSQVDTFVVSLSKHFVIIILPFMVTVVGLLISFHHAYGNHTRGIISLFEFNCIV